MDYWHHNITMTDQSNTSLLSTEYRCRCNKLLFKGLILQDHLNLVCPRCGELSEFSGVDVKKQENRFVLLCDNYGVIVNADELATLYTGYEIKDFIDKPISDFLYTKRDIDGDVEVSKYCHVNPYVRYDVRFKTQQGEGIFAAVTYKQVIIGTQYFVLRIFDITPVDELTAASSVISEAKTCDMVAETDGMGNILYIDHNSFRCLGYYPEELIGRHIKKIATQEEHDIQMRFASLAKLRVPYCREDYAAIHKDGTSVKLDVFSVPVYGEDGTFIGHKHMSWVR